MYWNPLNDYTMQQLTDKLRKKPQGIENDPEKIALAKMLEGMKEEEINEGSLFPFTPKE